MLSPRPMRRLRGGPRNKKAMKNLFHEQDMKNLTEARNVALQIAYEQGSVAADDVRERCAALHELSRNAIGSLFKTPDFIWQGVKRSRAKKRRGGLISTYILSEEAKCVMVKKFQRLSEMQ